MRGSHIRRRAVRIGSVIALALVAWEVFKWRGGDPWRLHGTVLGIRVDDETRGRYRPTEGLV